MPVFLERMSQNHSNQFDNQQLLDLSEGDKIQTPGSPVSVSHIADVQLDDAMNTHMMSDELIITPHQQSISIDQPKDVDIVPDLVLSPDEEERLDKTIKYMFEYLFPIGLGRHYGAMISMSASLRKEVFLLVRSHILQSRVCIDVVLDNSKDMNEILLSIFVNQSPHFLGDLMMSMIQQAKTSSPSCSSFLFFGLCSRLGHKELFTFARLLYASLVQEVETNSPVTTNPTFQEKMVPMDTILACLMDCWYCLVDILRPLCIPLQNTMSNAAYVCQPFPQLESILMLLCRSLLLIIRHPNSQQALESSLCVDTTRFLLQCSPNVTRFFLKNLAPKLRVLVSYKKMEVIGFLELLLCRSSNYFANPLFHDDMNLVFRSLCSILTSDFVEASSSVISFLRKKPIFANYLISDGDRLKFVGVSLRKCRSHWNPRVRDSADLLFDKLLDYL